mmetsp:Transcript_14799/g.41237  ORF Transcript_14799/g.41237 Transcript_14799/m.41237 type:complete len:1181 (+) Transcript_14799:176-3718(+)
MASMERQRREGGGDPSLDRYPPQHKHPNHPHYHHQQHHPTSRQWQQHDHRQPPQQPHFSNAHPDNHFHRFPWDRDRDSYPQQQQQQRPQTLSSFHPGSHPFPDRPPMENGNYNPNMGVSNPNGNLNPNANANANPNPPRTSISKLLDHHTRRRKWFDMTRTIAHYERIEQIGEGTYGQVYRARCKDTNEIVAMKKIRVHHGAHWGMPPTVIREIKILKSLVHPNLVRMVEVVSSKGVEHLDVDDYHKGSDRSRKKHKQQTAGQKSNNNNNSSASDKKDEAGADANGDGSNNNNNKSNPNSNNNNKQTTTDVADARESYKGNIFLVLEYVQHDLTGLLDVAYQFSEVEIKSIFRQLLEALAYMHEQKYVHRDIKSSNILIDRNYRLKLADFGLARSIEPPLLDKLHERGNTQEFTNKVITLWYRPPELLLGATRYGPAVDIWSAGCILAELVLGRPLFTGKTEMEQLQLIFDMVGTPNHKTWPGVYDLKLLRTGDVTIDEDKDRRRPKLRERYQTKMNNIAPGALRLVEKLLELDPSKRPTASQALRHRYFEGYKPPEMLGEMKLAEDGSFHEFQTKKKRKEAKVEAEKIRQTALDGGQTTKQAQEEYDAHYRSIMEEVAQKGLGIADADAAATSSTAKGEAAELSLPPPGLSRDDPYGQGWNEEHKHKQSLPGEVPDERGDHNNDDRSSSKRGRRSAEHRSSSSKLHRGDKDLPRRESSSSRGHRDKRERERKEGDKKDRGRDREKHHSDRDREKHSSDRDRDRSSSRRASESDDRRKRRHPREPSSRSTERDNDRSHREDRSSNKEPMEDPIRPTEQTTTKMTIEPSLAEPLKSAKDQTAKDETDPAVPVASKKVDLPPKVDEKSSEAKPMEVCEQPPEKPKDPSTTRVEDIVPETKTEPPAAKTATRPPSEEKKAEPSAEHRSRSASSRGDKKRSDRSRDRSRDGDSRRDRDRRDRDRGRDRDRDHHHHRSSRRSSRDAGEERSSGGDRDRDRSSSRKSSTSITSKKRKSRHRSRSRSAERGEARHDSSLRDRTDRDRRDRDRDRDRRSHRNDVRSLDLNAAPFEDWRPGDHPGMRGGPPFPPHMHDGGSPPRGPPRGGPYMGGEWGPPGPRGGDFGPYGGPRSDRGPCGPDGYGPHDDRNWGPPPPFQGRRPPMDDHFGDPWPDHRDRGPRRDRDRR